MKIPALLAMLTLTVSVASAQGNFNAAITNLANGERFLAQNKEREGVKVTKSGLQYEIIKEGSGAAPKTTNRVTVNYEGKLTDGTVFDSSYPSNKPATFGVTQVIRGWTEGLQLMKPGAVYMFYIPSRLAYGADGSGKIGPNECLIFKVELLSVQ